MSERVRLQKALSGAGLMSRRAAEIAIEEGRVAIDGRIAILGDRVDFASESLTLDGIPVNLDPEVETHLLYKPLGVVSTARDPEGRQTVVDLVPSKRRLYPVGRLDMDSEGLILVSNDGDLTNRVTHPRYGITKTYLAMVEGKMTKDTIRNLAAGIELEDGPARPVRVTIKDVREHSLVELVMVEGRNREVRRMLSAVGHEVIQLVRTAIGPIKAPDLPPGQSRLLTPDEIRTLLTSGNQ